MASNNTPNKPDNDSVAETAAEMHGKSKAESGSIGKIDRADDETEHLYAQDTSNSPVFKAFWNSVDLGMFSAQPAPVNQVAEAAIADCIRVARSHLDAGTIYGADNKLSDAVIADLAKAGYGGIRIPGEFGGKDADVTTFMNMIVRMAGQGDASIAGLASVHGCIGAVAPLINFGTEEQKKKYLPLLASWERQSAFALTEPGAGSDMTALKVTATPTADGQNVLINGRKVFITNALPGRVITLVTMMDGTPTCFIVELPEQENEHFKLHRYLLHPLVHVHNNGLDFKDFVVPMANRLRVPVDKNGKENGLLVAYKALALGRVAVLANAAGSARPILRSMAPDGWAAYRETYGRRIEERELVKGELARVGAAIVAMDAMVNWTSGLLDAGYRAEIECIVAKNMGARLIREIAIDIGTQVHGGRSLRVGHALGDNFAEFIAPNIYEGSKPMLSMSAYLSLSKAHSKRYMLPIGQAVQSLGKGKGVGSALGSLLKVGPQYAAWWAASQLRKLARNGRVSGWQLASADAEFQTFIDFAHREFGKLPLALSGDMRKYQLKLQDKQARIIRTSVKVQTLTELVVTAVAGAASTDQGTRLGASLFCRDIMQKLTGREPDARFDADNVRLGNLIIEGQFKQLENVPGATIIEPYKEPYKK
jgi:alkylation response protein AidB-like acyl-CoA dehydrogenase